MVNFDFFYLEKTFFFYSNQCSSSSHDNDNDDERARYEMLIRIDGASIVLMMYKNINILAANTKKRFFIHYFEFFPQFLY